LPKSCVVASLCGTLSKGVNFPGVYLSIKAMTDKDREDLMFGLDQGVTG